MVKRTNQKKRKTPTRLELSYNYHVANDKCKVCEHHLDCKFAIENYTNNERNIKVESCVNFRALSIDNWL